MNGVCALVPVKCFTRGKSRLDRVLGSPMRESLARSLCDRVLRVLREVATQGVVEGIVVATDCPLVERFATERGAEVVRDASVGSLASIVDRALAVTAARGAGAALVLMSDLPLLEPEDVRGLLASLADAPLVLAPDRVGEGTNALAISPPGRLATCFGSLGSFERHCARAASAGLPYAVYRSEGTASDLDSPEDLALLASQAERGARFSTKRNRSSRVRAA